MADILAQELTDDLKNLIFEKVKMVEMGYIGIYTHEHIGYKLMAYIKRNFREPKNHYIFVRVYEYEQKKLIKTVIGKETIVYNELMLLTLLKMVVPRHMCLLYKQGNEPPISYMEEECEMANEGVFERNSFHEYGHISDDEEDEDGVQKTDGNKHLLQVENAYDNMCKNVMEKIKNLLG